MSDAPATLQATVVVPTTGDRGPLLPYSVGSILAQSVHDLEVFIMGDGVDDATRAVILQLMRRDSRIRFFDHPKDVRRGEPYRHAALAEARGEIICYLTDRDLMLPNHIAVMSELLSRADFAHTLRFNVEPDESLRFSHTVDINHAGDRASLAEAPILIPLSFAGHTRSMYRRLPHGWRGTPPGKFTDRYMWEQFLATPECRTATSTRPTILYLQRGGHPGWPTEQRLAELQRWYGKISDALWRQEFEERVRDAAIRDRARLARGRAPAPPAATAPTAPINPSKSEPPARGSPSPPLARPEEVRPAKAARRERASPTLPRYIKRLRKIVPEVAGWMVRRLRYVRKERPRSAAAHITDLSKKNLQKHIRVETYWVGGQFGPGPGASVYVFDDEVMRFDCFGESKGHMHINMKQCRLIPGGSAARIKLAGTMAENIDRAVYELANNLEYCLRVNLNGRIRKIKLERAKLAETAIWLRNQLNQLAARKQPPDLAR